MSNKILNLVRDARIIDPVAKEVLKVIADQSNDAGTGVWSSYKYIAWCLERDRRTVIRKCNLLREMGILSSTQREGSTNLWSVDTVALQAVGVPYRDKIEATNETAGDTPSDTPPPGVTNTSDTVPLEEGQPATPVVTADHLSPYIAPNNQEPSRSEGKLREMDMADGIDPSYDGKELEYVDDIDGVPDERQIEWLSFIAGWLECFPKKAQPRKTNTALRTKFYARLKNAGFRQDWKKALWVSRHKNFLKEEGWFKAKWFVHNNDNYEKLLDGTFDFKLKQKKEEEVMQPARKEVATITADEWSNRRQG